MTTEQKTVGRSKNMQAAQVYFPADLYLEIKLISGKEGKAIAAWIRETVIQEVMKARKKRKKKFTDLPTFSNWNVEPNTSEKIDEIVYDTF